MHTLNPEMTTGDKKQVQENFQFGWFSSKPSLVMRLGQVGAWCQDLKIYESLRFLDLGTAMHSLNAQMMTGVKIQVQEDFQFGQFSNTPSLVLRIGQVIVWCQELEIFESLGF